MGEVDWKGVGNGKSRKKVRGGDLRKRKDRMGSKNGEGRRRRELEGKGEADVEEKRVRGKVTRLPFPNDCIVP